MLSELAPSRFSSRLVAAVQRPENKSAGGCAKGTAPKAIFGAVLDEIIHMKLRVAIVNYSTRLDFMNPVEYIESIHKIAGKRPIYSHSIVAGGLLVMS